MSLPSTSLAVPGRNSVTPKKEHKLSELQQKVVDLVTSNRGLNQVQMAKELKCNRVSVSRILSNQYVKEAILSNVNGSLLSVAHRALATQSKLLTSKSDYIRHQAAKDLLDRNAIGDSTTVLGQAISVKIDLS